MNSLSVGVRSVFSDVNCRSKFDTSLRCFCDVTREKEICVSKYAQVGGQAQQVTYNLWLERWLHLPVLNLFPIDTAEEGVRTNVLLAASSTAQAFLRVFGEQLKHGNTVMLMFFF